MCEPLSASSMNRLLLMLWGMAGAGYEPSCCGRATDSRGAPGGGADTQGSTPEGLQV